MLENLALAKLRGYFLKDCRLDALFMVVYCRTQVYRIKSVFKYGLEWLKNVLVNARIKNKEFLILIGLLKNSFLRGYGVGVVE